eukprot:c21104_g3_i1 orf=66-1532(+)
MELSAFGASANTAVMTSSLSSSSKSSSASSSQAPVAAVGGGVRAGVGPMQAWWESVNKARERIKALKEIIGPLSSLEALQESERPAKGLLEEESVAHAILTRLISPSSGHGQDPICHWLYDTFETGEPDLQAIVLRFIPAICGLFLPRVTSHVEGSLAGFEAVLLALYTAEAKARNGRSLVVHVADLSQPSLYHTPRIPSYSRVEPRIGRISAALEPQDAVRATKRACIVGIALDLFYRRIAFMPSEAKIEACQCALRWAYLSCSKDQESMDATEDGDASTINGNGERVLDSNYYLGTPSPTRQVPEIEIVGPGELFFGNKSPSHWSSSQHYLHSHVVTEMSSSPKWSPALKDSPIEPSRAQMSNQVSLPTLQNNNTQLDFVSLLMQAGNGARVQLSWELLQPLLKILGHCLLAPSNSVGVKEAASAAIGALHRRAFHDLLPEAMLATQSLLRLQMASKAMTKPDSSSSNPLSTSPKPRKPEILLVSK